MSVTNQNNLILHWLCTLILCAVGLTNAQAQEDEIHLLPADLMQGSEILASITKQPAGVDRELQFVLADGSIQILTTVVTDALGHALARAPLPDVPPGDYLVELFGDRAVLDTAAISVTAGPVVMLDPPSGYGGQRVTVQVSGLTPGTVALQLDGVPMVGPLIIEGTTFSSELIIPEGGESILLLTVQNRIGDRLVGSGAANFQRHRTIRTTGEVLSVNLPAEPFRRGELREISGQLALPDGRGIDEYEITLVWRLEDGTMIPINVEPVQFTRTLAKSSHSTYDFSAMVVTPSPKVGFAHIDLDQATDEFGFVYRNPSTGKSGYWAINKDGSPINLDDGQGIVITGRVIDSTNPDNQTNGIEDAIVAIVGETRLIDPADVGKDVFEFFSKGTTNSNLVRVSNAAGLLWQDNQIFAAAQDLVDLVVTDTGCPVTLNLKQTDANGNYTIAFSPELTEFLSLFRDRVIDTSSGTFVPTGTITRDQFTVRISALHLQDAFGLPATAFDNQSFTGLRYDFQRDDLTGAYKFREGLER